MAFASAKRNQDISRLSKELTDKKTEIETSFRQENAAEARGKRSDAAGFASLREQVLIPQQNALEADLASTIASDLSTTSEREADVEDLVRIGTDIVHILTLAEAAPKQVGAIIQEIIPTIWVRRLTRYAYVVEAELANGQRVPQVVLVESDQCSPFARAYCACLLGTDLVRWVETGDPDARIRVTTKRGQLAVELAEVPGQFAKVSWSEWRVVLAAISFHVLDPTVSRIGTHEAVPDLARRLGEPEAAVFGAALRGVLGPPTVIDGVPMVCPTGAEVHGVFPEAARRQIAGQWGWPVDDTLTTKEFWQKFHTGWVAERAAKAGVLVRDASGRRWLRASSLNRPLPRTLEQALTEATAEIQALDQQYWMILPDAKRRLNVSASRILRVAPWVYAGHYRAGPASRYVWIGPPVAASLALPTLAEAASEYAELGYVLADFRPRAELLESLRSRGCSIRIEALQSAARAGLIIEVFAGGGVRGAERRSYFAAPGWVWTSTDAGAVCKYLLGHGANSRT